MSIAGSAHAAGARMAPVQWLTLGVCIFINMLDGFDVLAIAFAAPAIAEGWKLSHAQLGILFSAGLVGMMLGSLFLAPLGDRIGRKPVILISLAFVSAGMFGSALSPNHQILAATRVATGIGVGALLAGLTAIVAELTPEKRRALALSLLQSAYPVGAIAGGAVAAPMIAGHGWSSIFILGGALPAAMIPLVLVAMPESLDFLLARRRPDALGRVNALLKRLRRPALDRLPDSPASAARASVSTLLSGPYRRNTLLIWFAYVMVMMTLYFALNWTPKVIVDADLTNEQGIHASVLMNVGGVIGAAVFGLLSLRFREARVLVAYLAICMLALAAFGWVEARVMAMWAAAFGVGFFLHASVIGLYTLLPNLYPASVRATGAGWAIGIGRIGAVIGPAAAGYLFATGFGRMETYALFGLPLLCALAAVAAMRR